MKNAMKTLNESKMSYVFRAAQFVGNYFTIGSSGIFENLNDTSYSELWLQKK